MTTPALVRRRVERVMGTAVTVAVPGGCPPALLDELFAWWGWVDRTFSVHRPDSQVSLIGAGAPVPGGVHPLVDEVLDRCAALFFETGGWFDAWPEGPTGRVDPSGYVKGWSVDVAATLLEGEGVADYCITAGGDLRAAGCADGGEPWRIGVQHPIERRAVAAILQATGLAVATSGAYERGPHIWGPSRDRALLSATVVGPRLGTADALATGLFGAGGTESDWFGRFDGYDYLIIGTDHRLRTTQGLRRFLLPPSPESGGSPSAP
ncbi:MAG TPA: FAD:protein FMN transferase [Acidimicrobiia bacterium]|nr:FAD:protein FMN transferase [Acidimicrobiia bacterium]